MRLQLIQKILGLFLLLYSLTLLPEIFLSVYFDDHELLPFAGSLLLCLVAGLLLWLPVAQIEITAGEAAWWRVAGRWLQSAAARLAALLYLQVGEALAF